MQFRIQGLARTALLVASVPLFAQTPAPPAAFEVATIKLSEPIDRQAILSGKAHLGMRVDAGRVDIGFETLSDLICTAYNLKPYQVTGPDWLKSQRFDVVPKMPAGATKEQVPDMLKALLAERFKLAVHHESKEQPVYALIVAKGGSKLKESPADASAAPPPADDKKTAATLNVGNNQLRVTPSGGNSMVVSGGENGKQTMTMRDGVMHMEIEKVTMSKFAESLTPLAGRPVVDQTGLKGTYQVALDLSMQDIQSAARAAGIAMPGMGAAGGAPGGGSPADVASDPSGGATLFNSLQQLGLKLEPRKNQMDGLVVDSIEKLPTEN